MLLFIGSLIVNKFLFVLLVAVGSINQVYAAENPVTLLSGDKKYACEALMCLNAGVASPQECNPAIHRYKLIRRKHRSDEIRARKEFLRKCPMDNPQEREMMINAVVYR